LNFPSLFPRTMPELDTTKGSVRVSESAQLNPHLEDHG
jgi:hypothetical protein